ncbi:hypothetical protein EZS27_035929, partial [termite gut metagenome]
MLSFYYIYHEKLQSNNMKSYIAFLTGLFFILQATAQPLQRIAPELAGMDSRRLLYADEAIQKAIDNKEIPGAVLAIVHHG